MEVKDRKLSSGSYNCTIAEMCQTPLACGLSTHICGVLYYGSLYSPQFTLSLFPYRLQRNTCSFFLRICNKLPHAPVLSLDVIVQLYTLEENFHSISTFYSNKIAYFNVLWMLHMYIGFFLIIITVASCTHLMLVNMSPNLNQQFFLCS